MPWVQRGRLGATCDSCGLGAAYTAEVGQSGARSVVCAMHAAASVKAGARIVPLEAVLERRDWALLAMPADPARHLRGPRFGFPDPADADLRKG